MKEKKKITKKIIPIITALIVFAIPLTYSMFKSYARTNKSLELASWDVTLNQSGENNYLSISPDPNSVDASYTVNITSKSEVDIIYSIVIENLPSGVSISLDNGSFIQETNNKVIFSDIGTILYSDENKTKSHIITFKAEQTATLTNEQEVNVNVIARQTL